MIEGRMKAFRDRVDAGRQLAAALATAGLGDEVVVVGLARGGVTVAAEVAAALGAPLDAVAVRKVGHPRQPEYALGAVAPGADGVFLRDFGGLGEAELAAVIEGATASAEELDRTFHDDKRQPVDLHAKVVVLVDDGLATGATMIAAIRWARSRGAARVVAAAPVAAAQTAALVRREADALICPYEIQRFGAVGFWYGRFDQVGDDEVIGLLDRARV
jgi:putative phosphoribosyl transferase